MGSCNNSKNLQNSFISLNLAAPTYFFLQNNKFGPHLWSDFACDVLYNALLLVEDFYHCVIMN
jgi:hypothetical protein